MDQFESSDDWNYSVAWINGFSKNLKLGQGIFLKGKHALKNDLNRDFKEIIHIKFTINFGSKYLSIIKLNY